jgi:hypothetical protein
LEINQLGLEAEHSFSSNAEVKNAGAIISLPHTSLWHGGLINHRDNFAFAFALPF